MVRRPTLKRAVDFDAAFLDWQKKGHSLEYKER